MNIFYTLSRDMEWRKASPRRRHTADALLRYTQGKAIASGKEKCGWTAVTVSVMVAVGVILFKE